MRVYRAMGDREERRRSTRPRTASTRRTRPDAPSRPTCRRGDPWANRESLPIHVHAEAEPPPAAAPAWVATIGPKGYETDLGYLTKAHPPVPSEREQWSYVTAQPRPAGAPRVSSVP